MANIQELKALLAAEYGIHSCKELSDAIGKIGKLDIGVAVSPVRRNEDACGREEGSRHEFV